MEQIKECVATIYDLCSKININKWSMAEGVSCDEAGCVAEMADGGLVAMALRPEALEDDCERAALVVTAKQPPPTCLSPLMSEDRLRSQGAIALRRTRNGFVVDAVKPKGIDRPWSPAVGGTAEAEPNLVRPTAGRAVDATPSEADVQADE
jgi:competence protein ComEC